MPYSHCMATESTISIPVEDYKNLSSILKGRDADAIRKSRQRTARLCKSIAAQKNSKVPCFVYDEVYDIPRYWHRWRNESTVASGAY